MKKIMVLAVLAVAAVCMTGCEQKSEAEQAKSDAAAQLEKAKKQGDAAAKDAQKSAGNLLDSAKKLAK